MPGRGPAGPGRLPAPAGDAPRPPDGPGLPAPASSPGPLPAGLCDADTAAARLDILADVVRALATSHPELLPVVHWVHGQPCFATADLTAGSR